MPSDMRFPMKVLGFRVAVMIELGLFFAFCSLTPRAVRFLVMPVVSDPNFALTGSGTKPLAVSTRTTGFRFLGCEESR